jgi:hypothetical protein
MYNEQLYLCTINTHRSILQSTVLNDVVNSLCIEETASYLIFMYLDVPVVSQIFILFFYI